MFLIENNPEILAINKSGSESSISENCDSMKETIKSFEAERDEISDKGDETAKMEALEVPKANMSKRGSLTSAKSLHELKHDSSINNKAADNDDTSKPAGIEKEVKGIRPSKSDTSLTDSFVVVDNEYNKRKHCPNVLREGSLSIIFSHLHQISMYS